MPPQTFYDVLEQIRKEATSKRDLGTKFEKITRDFFKTDKLYSNRFSKVYLWKEWPGNDGADTGIDLIAEERNGSLCAIQCKCYDDDGSLDMKSISTFFAKTSSLSIQNTILVYTGDYITNHAQKILKDSRCQLLLPSGFHDSSIDWSNYPRLVKKKPKKLREHQKRALKDTLQGLESHDRGRLIMACGTGKTLTSLHVAEQHSGTDKMVLYLVPSISLILQTMREWSENANLNHSYIVVCSDKTTGEDGSITELEAPVSTDPDTLKQSLQNIPKNTMTVIFSTYHSLPVVIEATKGRRFDLILCDEAHRTTGVEDKSFFTMVHDNKKIKSSKRLYMTATPRVYSDIIKAKLGKIIYSMDDIEKYGPEFHIFSFTDAVQQDVLSDFRVKIAIVPPNVAANDFLEAISSEHGEIPLDERTLLASVWHGINYPADTKTPMLLQRVIAFANRIDRSRMFAGNITDEHDTNRSLKNIADALEPSWKTGNTVEIRHVDGKTNAISRRKYMHWLNESTGHLDTCRILSNARCLSEGVDVPALDGVIFLNPRKSKVDVVQSVGRVMRKSPGKEYGYVILPIALPPGKPYHEALDDNETFRIVWQVLNALRSHDEDFANEINRLVLDKNTENTNPTPRISISILDSQQAEEAPRTEFFKRIKSKLVEKVGDISYYDKYGRRLGGASANIESIITAKMSQKSVSDQVHILQDGLKGIINDSITIQQTIRVISQHMVLSRIFDALFTGKFAPHNPISATLNGVVSNLRLDAELESLKEFYETAESEIAGIKTREARQNFIKKIYENFFKAAAKKETEQLGIVYTPVEIIDFILYSVQDVLHEQFDTDFADDTVKVLDPFTGTGTFISRLIESGMLGDSLDKKYKTDLYANEMILLAYYVATVNIETTYSSIQNKYEPFGGISYTDTLELNPRYLEDKRHRQEETKLDDIFRRAHERVRHQRLQQLEVICGNPPYSAGQSDFNDQNQNVQYPDIDARIENTYLKKTKSINPKIGLIRSLYDSYIRSLRWASDRIGESGIIGFVTNGSFIRSEAVAGLRACLQDEFTDIWVFDLRGNQRTQGEISRKEGGKIFGSGSRAPVAITILVKNPTKKSKGVIHYYDIGDYHSREKKLDIIRTSRSITGIFDWQTIKPDKHHDWLDQRHDEFNNYLPMGSKDAKAGKGHAVFKIYSSGIGTSRDMWVYNSSEKDLSKNMKVHIGYCNSQEWKNGILISSKGKSSRDLRKRIKRYGKQTFVKNKIRHVSYRPFFNQWLYYDSIFNETPGLSEKFFPENNSENLVIIVPHKIARQYSTFITDVTPDLELIHHGQCFPLHIHKNGKRQDNITDMTLKEYRQHYKDNKISKLDIFYYIYGLLHHLEYRKKYANNLVRELPHIPMAPDFWAFCTIGRKLADLHLSWETCKRYDLGKPKAKFGKYEKMDFARIKKDGKMVKDTKTLKINGIIVFENIPETKYRVNGRTPLEWAIDRYKLHTDKDSGITNDATKGLDGKPLDIIPLIERLVYVGVESDRLVSELPKEFEPPDWKPVRAGLDNFIKGPAQSRLM